MEAQLEQIREQQKAVWNRFSPGWKKWDAFTMNFLQPMGAAIIESLHIKESDHVLDIATGTGEPGLTIAGIAKKGKVTATDLSEDMLKIAAQNAADKGLKNFETKPADCCELPFADDHFDVVSCRMGFMFFPDMKMAAREMFRVLKPGGRMATSVWGAPEKNFWIGAMMGTLSKHIEMPAPVPGGPGMFRCAKPGLMAAILEEAGFSNVSEKELTGKIEYQNADQYWENMMEVAAPVVSAMSKSDDATKADIKKELFNLLHSKYPSGTLLLDFASLIFYGEKPLSGIQQ